MKKKFKKFLKDHRLYAAFIRNLNNSDCNGWSASHSNENSRESAFNYYLTRHSDPFQWVGSGFIWSDTPEDMRWMKIDDEWEEACHECSYT